jgi:hypothetical protein
MAGLYDDQVGELAPGQTGWLPLADDGTPSGPATISPPPGPNAKACSVKHNEQEAIDAGHDVLVSSSGAPLSPPLQSNVDRRVGGPTEPPPEVLVPTLTLLTPDTAPAGTDLSLMIAGNDLDGATEVLVNGTSSAVTAGTDSSVSTTVLAATLVEGSAIVSVTTPNGPSNTLSLTVTAPVGRDSRGQFRRG